MAQVAFPPISGHGTNNEYELSERTDPDPDNIGVQNLEVSSEEGVEIANGAAMNKMKILAQRIYESTPGIDQCKSNYPISSTAQLLFLFFEYSHYFFSSVIPKKKSKILSEADEEAEERAKRARNFITKCEQIQDVRKKRKANEEIKKTESALQNYMNKADDRRGSREEKRLREELSRTKAIHGSIADKDLGK